MKSITLTTLALLAIFGARGQGLDLETCLKMADTANLSIRNARLDMEANETQTKAYMSARLPKVTATGDYKYNAIIPGQVVPAAFFGGPPGTYSTVQFGVPYNLSNTVQLTQIIYNPQVNYGLKALEINAKVLEVQQTMKVQEIKEQVANTYFTLQAINKQLVFTKGNIASMDKLIANMTAMKKAELVIQTEVDKLSINRLNLLNAEQTLEATKLQLEDMLKILIGLPDDANVALAPDTTVEQTILVDETAIHRPELDLMAAQIEMNKAERNGTTMAYLPSLSFYAAYNYTYNMKPEDDFRTGIESAFVGLRLDWTLFDGLEKANKQKVNTINYNKLSNQEALLEQQLSMATENAKRQVEIQKNSLAIAKEKLMLSQRVYDQTALMFNEGTISSNDLITADNGLQEAQSNLVGSYVQLRQAEIAYLKSIGSIK